MEASIGGDFLPLPDNLLETTREKLDFGTALFSFHLGTSISWVWELDREGLEVYPLPDRATSRTGQHRNEGHPRRPARRCGPCGGLIPP
jgi:hypothetical protein